MCVLPLLCGGSCSHSDTRRAAARGPEAKQRGREGHEEAAAAGRQHHKQQHHTIHRLLTRDQDKLCGQRLTGCYEVGS